MSVSRNQQSKTKALINAALNHFLYAEYLWVGKYENQRQFQAALRATLEHDKIGELEKLQNTIAATLKEKIKNLQNNDNIANVYLQILDYIDQALNDSKTARTVMVLNHKDIGNPIEKRIKSGEMEIRLNELRKFIIKSAAKTLIDEQLTPEFIHDENSLSSQLSTRFIKQDIDHISGILSKAHQTQINTVVEYKREIEEQIKNNLIDLQMQNSKIKLYSKTMPIIFLIDNKKVKDLQELNKPDIWQSESVPAEVTNLVNLQKQYDILSNLINEKPDREHIKNLHQPAAIGLANKIVNNARKARLVEKKLSYIKEPSLWKPVVKFFQKNLGDWVLKYLPNAAFSLQIFSPLRKLTKNPKISKNAFFKAGCQSSSQKIKFQACEDSAIPTPFNFNKLTTSEDENSFSSAYIYGSPSRFASDTTSS